MKGGLLEGYLRSLTGLSFETPLYDWPVIVFGMAYVYFPFMLFPLAQGISLVPDDARLAASDLGASPMRILFEIEMPLAAPGIMVGSLLTFILSAGAVAEAKLLGGRAVVVLTDDVESAFTFAQNWPLGSALSLMLIVIVALLVLVPVSRVNLDAIMGRKPGDRSPTPPASRFTFTGCWSCWCFTCRWFRSASHRSLRRDISAFRSTAIPVNGWSRRSPARTSTRWC